MIEIGVYLRWRVGGRSKKDLTTPCMIAPPDNHDRLERNGVVFCGLALWDTGARMSAISDKVISQCGLIPLKDRVEKIYDVGGGTTTSKVYEVSLSLTGTMLQEKMEVVTLPRMDYPIIVGMDFIGKCDVFFWNADGKKLASIGCPLHPLEP